MEMKVVLREDVEKLGLRGEVVDVARGYARNFLLPRKLAEPATPSRVAELEKVNARRALSEAQSFEQAQEIASGSGRRRSASTSRPARPACSSAR